MATAGEVAALPPIAAAETSCGGDSRGVAALSPTAAAEAAPRLAQTEAVWLPSLAGAAAAAVSIVAVAAVAFLDSAASASSSNLPDSGWFALIPSDRFSFNDHAITLFRAALATAHGFLAFVAISTGRRSLGESPLGIDC